MGNCERLRIRSNFVQNEGCTWNFCFLKHVLLHVGSNCQIIGYSSLLRLDRGARKFLLITEKPPMALSWTFPTLAPVRTDEIFFFLMGYYFKHLFGNLILSS